MARWWVMLLVGTTGCSVVTTQKVPLILLADVPVPADARWTNDEEDEIGGDGGGGLLFLNNQADPTEGIFESLETDEVEGAEEGTLYYEGTEQRTFFSLFVFFFEGVSFDAKVVRLKAKPLPAEAGSTVDAPSSPEPEPESEPTVEPEPEPEPDAEPAVESEAEPSAAEEPAEEESKTKKKKKKRKKKKRKKKGRK
jgi:hypothetical protein